MLALSSSMFSTFGWPLEEDLISHEQHNNNNNTIFYIEAETSDQSFLHFPPPPNLSQPLANSSEFKLSNEVFGDATMAKKLNHNASERDRRKKINSLYSSLRSLLPAADQTKKLSIPTTVSHVLKYIPELQSELERLVHKKEELISRINSRQQEELLSHIDIEKKRKCATGSPLSAVSASPLGDREFVIQICTVKLNNSPLSEILLNLEMDYGLLLLNASCFESFGERVFYNLHLQVQGNQRVEIETLREKLLSLYEKSEELFS
ncbi:unnamed protein product [Camellia sinensis]